MDGLRQIFSTFRLFCRALSLVLGVAIILAGVFPASAMNAGHFASDQAQMTVMNDPAVPADRKVQDHKDHAVCGPGVGCFSFTVPAEEASALAPFSAVFGRFDTVQLVTRIVAPPLPPPKIIIPL